MDSAVLRLPFLALELMLGFGLTHPSTIVEANHTVENNIVRGDPRHPVEDAQCLEYGIGEPKVDEHYGKSVQEELVSRRL